MLMGTSACGTIQHLYLPAQRLMQVIRIVAITKVVWPPTTSSVRPLFASMCLPTKRNA